MSCFDSYITISPDTPSRSGRYAINLPGVSEDLLNEIKKEQHADAQEFWDETLYPTAWKNLVSDITTELQNKFFVNLKLVSRVTSEFQDTVNSNSGLAGVKIKFNLPRYARLHIISLGVYSEQDYASPEVEFKIYEKDENGDLLYEKSSEISEGKNTINIDQDFEVDELFVSFDPEAVEFRKTDNKFYHGCEYWNTVSCEWPCYWGGVGSVIQVNGGGINVIYNVYCSVEKFVCENINIFETAFYYKIGQEIIHERIIGETLNKYTAMSKERADQLSVFYQSQYGQELMNAVKAQKIQEDPICFDCKKTISVQSTLP